MNLGPLPDALRNRAERPPPRDRRRLIAPVLLVLLIAAAAAVAATRGGGAGTKPDASYDGTIYIESNQAAPNANSVLAFRYKDGNLRPLSVREYITSGRGSHDLSNHGVLDAEQQVVTNADNTLLFAPNAGSDTIAAFHIEKDGSLIPVNGSPLPSPCPAPALPHREDRHPHTRERLPLPVARPGAGDGRSERRRAVRGQQGAGRHAAAQEDAGELRHLPDRRRRPSHADRRPRGGPRRIVAHADVPSAPHRAPDDLDRGIRPLPRIHDRRRRPADPGARLAARARGRRLAGRQAPAEAARLAAGARGAPKAAADLLGRREHPAPGGLQLRRLRPADARELAT